MLIFESLTLYVKDASEETQGQDLAHVFKDLNPRTNKQQLGTGL